MRRSVTMSDFLEFTFVSCSIKLKELHLAIISNALGSKKQSTYF